MTLVILSPLHKAYRQISLYMQGQLSRFGVAPQEGHLLSYLASYAPCPVSELVRVFGFKPSTLTSMLDRMERLDLLKREVNPDDRRSFLVELTQLGQHKATEIGEVVRNLERELVAKVGTSNLDGFAAVMTAIDEHTRITLRGRDTAGESTSSPGSPG